MDRFDLETGAPRTPNQNSFADLHKSVDKAEKEQDTDAEEKQSAGKVRGGVSGQDGLLFNIELNYSKPENKSSLSEELKQAADKITRDLIRVTKPNDIHGREKEFEEGIVSFQKEVQNRIKEGKGVTLKDYTLHMEKNGYKIQNNPVEKGINPEYKGYLSKSNPNRVIVVKRDSTKGAVSILYNRSLFKKDQGKGFEMTENPLTKFNLQNILAKYSAQGSPTPNADRTEPNPQILEQVEKGNKFGITSFKQ